MRDAIDIILLTHNRLDHLVAMVDALEERTHEPYRLTIVDNASGPELRNWLAANHERLHQVILRPDNEHVPAFQHGIDATTSDPYIVCDPDIVVPDLHPSWLAQLRGLMDRHPDFGLIGIGCDTANRPEVLGPEVIDPAAVVDGEIVETGVGTVMQMIRRAALPTPYRSDWRTCTDVQRAGWRVGWAPGPRRPGGGRARGLGAGHPRAPPRLGRPPPPPRAPGQQAPALRLLRRGRPDRAPAHAHRAGHGRSRGGAHALRGRARRRR